MPAFKVSVSASRSLNKNFFFFLQSMETPIHECSRSGNNDILIALLESIPPSKLQLTVNKRSLVSSSNYFSPNCKVYLPFQSVFEFHDMWFLLSLVGLRKNSDYLALKFWVLATPGIYQHPSPSPSRLPLSRIVNCFRHFRGRGQVAALGHYVGWSQHLYI